MLPWRKHLSWFSDFLIQNVLYTTVLSNKVSYKGFDTQSSLCCSCLSVCSVALRWCCSSVLKRWKGLKMLLLNLGFLWVKRKYTCFIPGLSSNNELSTYGFFLLLEFNFFPFWFQNFRLFWHHWILNYKHSRVSLFTLSSGPKILVGVNLSWTSGCRYLQEERNFLCCVP